MTAKEKAQELYDKFYDIEPTIDWEAWGISEELAKKCALVAVDEIIKQCWDYRDIDLEESCDYWKQVKQEIEKL